MFEPSIASSIVTCDVLPSLGMILQRVMEFGGRFICSCDGSTSGSSSSGSVLSAPLAVAVACWDGVLVSVLVSFFCFFRNASKCSMSMEYNESIQYPYKPRTFDFLQQRTRAASRRASASPTVHRKRSLPLCAVLSMTTNTV